jgi:hypothetical protein
MQYRLNLMQRLYNDPYRLLLYLLWSIGQMGWQAIITILPGLYVSWLIPAITGKPRQPMFLETILLPASGLLFGWIWNLRKTVADLYDFEARKKHYEEKIKKLQP